MIEKIIELDKQILIYLNNLGSPIYDWFWLLDTKPLSWLPIFAIVLFYLYKKLGQKNFFLSLIFIALIVLFSDQTANLFKNYFQRLRPCNDESLQNLIRIVGNKSTSYSFFSGHATNSMATATFVYLILKNQFKLSYLVFVFPIIFAYSRIYLGLHFPFDVITGYVFGAFYGILFYKIFKKIILKKL